MKVIEYLKQYGIQSLHEVFGVKVKAYGDLLVLNYDQIESPKTEEIVMECRGLILDSYYNVVSRSFDRFFNYGECLYVTPDIDLNSAEVYEKVDGSLIKIYNHKGEWFVATRGTAFAESGVNGFDVTFKDLVYKALGVGDDFDFNELCNSKLDSGLTYIFEVTSMENRVVKRYNGYTLWFLAARSNKTMNYVGHLAEIMLDFGAKLPKKYKFDSIEACMSTVNGLKDLDEGFVIYQKGIPVCKIKSPVYLAVHRIRGEGLTPKRIKQLVLINEQDEYLTYFPEDKEHFNKYVIAMENMREDIVCVFYNNVNIEDKKEFALAVKDYPFSSCLFQAKNSNKNPLQVFNDMRESYKIKVLDEYMGEIK